MRFIYYRLFKGVILLFSWILCIGVYIHTAQAEGGNTVQFSGSSDSIPDATADGEPGVVQNVIDISNAVTVVDVMVTVDVTHGYDADLAMTVISPSQQRVELTNRNGQSGDHYTDTVFTDDAEAVITDGLAPFTGEYRPEEPLSQFAGESSLGIWILEIQDLAYKDSGTLNAWTITIVYEDDEDNDGYVSINAGGADCDDENADIYPNAFDIPYDGIDQDCSGSDAVDVDGDGYIWKGINKGNDCDDTDAALNPHAIQENDGYDTDCDGTAEDLDQYRVSTSPSLSIPEQGTDKSGETISIITVPEDFLIADVNVAVDITHTFDNDLMIYLQSPQGTRVDLATQRGGAEDDFFQTVFDDSAYQNISEGSAPFSSTFQPETSLGSFIGLSTVGEWTLVVQDHSTGDDGMLNEWSLFFTVSNPDRDVDGYVSAALVSGKDCDDYSADIHPSADEVVDGIDNNCTNTIDETVVSEESENSSTHTEAVHEAEIIDLQATRRGFRVIYDDGYIQRYTLFQKGKRKSTVQKVKANMVFVVQANGKQVLLVNYYTGMIVDRTSLMEKAGQRVRVVIRQIHDKQLAMILSERARKPAILSLVHIQQKHGKVNVYAQKSVSTKHSDSQMMVRKNRLTIQNASGISIHQYRINKKFHLVPLHR